MQKQQQDHLKIAIPTSASKLLDAQKDMVDQLAQLKTTLETMKPLTDEAEKLRKQMVTLADLHFMPHEQAILEGHKHKVIFSPQPDIRVIEDLNGLIGLLKEKVGYEGLLGMLKISMEDIDKHLTPLEIAPYIKMIPGSRKFTGHT